MEYARVLVVRWPEKLNRLLLPWTAKHKKKPRNLLTTWKNRIEKLTKISVQKLYLEFSQVFRALRTSSHYLILKCNFHPI